MFLDELTPIFRELIGHPVAFLGGLVSGGFRLSLSDDPIKSWLDQQTGIATPYSSMSSESHNGKSGPQTIEIE